MKREDWRRAYEPLPEALESRVSSTLASLEEEKTVHKLSLRTALIALALILALCGAAYAVYESVTADLFGWFYGGSWKEEMQNGDIAPMGQSYQMGDARYTLEEMVYKSEGDLQGLYGVVRIAPAEGTNVLLLPEDISVNDPAGYILHYQGTGRTVEADAPSYAELAQQRGAKLLVTGLGVNSLNVNGEDRLGGSYGLSGLPQEDGSILMTLEIAGSVPRSDHYTLALELYSWQVTPEGIPLRDEPDSTWLEADWTVEVTPMEKENEP